MNNYKDRAIPLISVDQASGKYILAQQAQQFLRSVPGPIGVVSVAGLYRTGKSYLLNQMLLNRSNGFGVGPTVNPCTKGLWCWGTPIKGETSDGEKLNIIVIDTEGIGALDEDQTHDTRIFTLAILASSCFIYNSVGSIDENAVQNLSLVVNLTKHIQVRTNSSEQQDPDKIANHFPSFFWVVRDFTLQMTDPEGNKMSSKEYLEKALSLHKGNSQDIQEKNNIRKMLTSFFKERECFTLVRPLINEEKLQDLDKMSFDDLRPEFINQVIGFRKRVIGRMKPKTLNGQKLDGQLYLSMLNSYVGAINQGAVPNIENAWSYMCQEQCTKLLAESYETFQREIKQVKIPCSNEDINRVIESASESAFEIFKKKSFGEQSDRFLKQLQTRIKEKSKQIRLINAEQGKAAYKKYFTQFISMIQPKMSQYKSFEDFLQEINKIEEKATKEGPNYVDSHLNCQIIIRKLLSQGITHLSRSLKNEKEHIKKTLQERIKLNENEIENLRKEKDSEQSNLKEKLSQLDKEKIDLVFKLEKMDLEFQRNAKERSAEELNLAKNLNAKKAEIQQIRKQFDLKVSEANSRVEEMNSKVHQDQSNWDKEKAIFELRVKQQGQRIEQLEKKRQVFDSKLALETSELSQKHREQSNKYQEQIQDLFKTLNQKKQSLEELTKKFQQITEKHQNLTEKFEGTERKLREQTHSKVREIERIKNEHELQITKINNNLSLNKDESEKLGKDLQQKLRKQQSKSKETLDELKNVKSKYERENQTLAQDLQFAKKSSQEAKQKYLEQKNYYESRIAAIEMDSGLELEGQVNRKISELKMTHEEQIRNYQKEAKETQRNLLAQIETLTKDRNDLELKFKVNSEQLASERSENEECNKNLKLKNEQLENEMKTLQRQRSSQLITKQGIYNQKIFALQNELEQARQNYHSHKIQTQSKINNEITQIKNYYEMQRQKQQARHSQEKDKQKKKYNKMLEDYQKRIQQQNQSHEEQVQRLESQMGNQIRTLSMSINQLTHEKETIAREKVNIESKFTALSEQFTKVQTDLNERLSKLTETSKIQKESLLKKNEQLHQNKNILQKQLLSITHQRDQFKNLSEKQTIEIQQFKNTNANLLQKFQTTKNTLETKLKQIQNNYMNDKSKFQTNIALLQQKKDFAQLKITQLESEIKNTRERQQEQTKLMKEKHQQEVNALTLKATNQKKNYEEKIEKLKTTSVEIESSLRREISQASKAKAIDEQKIEFLEKKLNDSEAKRTSEVDYLNEQLKNIKEKLTLEREQLKTKIDQLEESLHKRQNQLSDQKSQYEIQLALAESKIKNLQSYSETTIFEKNEQIKALQRQLDDSRRRNENEKSSQQSTHQQIVTRMQSKYRNQITQLSQDLIKRNQEIQYITKEHQRIIKDLNEKLAVERQNKLSLENKAVRIQTEFNLRQSKLVADVDKLRLEKDTQSLETQKALAREKENFKSKLYELERRSAQSDEQKQQAFFEKEKMQAKWQMQKASLEEKLEELRDQVDREKNEGKKLLRDNEKLKAEKKKNSSFINIKNTSALIPRDTNIENKQNSQVQ